MENNLLLFELMDSENEQNCQELPNNSPHNNKYDHPHRKNSSGNFEILEGQFQTPSSQIIQINGLIVVGHHKPAELTTFEWRQYFTVKEPVGFELLANAVHSIVKGLDDEKTLLFWNSACEKQPQSNIKLKQNTSNVHFKYQQQIKQSLDKLEKRYISIGYSMAQMKLWLPEVLMLLNHYSVEDPEVGFSRGMEYLAFGIVEAAIAHPNVGDKLLANKQLYLSHIMKKLQLRGTYLPSKPNIFSKTKKLETQIEKELPSVIKAIQELNLDCSKIFFKYYLGLFLYQNCHRVLVSRILQLLLLEGQNFVTRLLVRLLIQLEQDIIKLSRDKLQSYLRNDLFKCYFKGVSDDKALQLFQQLIVKRTAI